MRLKLLIILIILGALFRFIALGSNPPSLNWDEVAIGWNAYSILQTGKDEYGTYLPLTFRSFDDYKSPLYIYLTSAALFLFGKNEFAIRFTSAFFGVLTIPIFYLLCQHMLRTTTTIPIWKNRIANISLFAAAILTISPWHIHFSRVAFEANIALFWELAGILFLLKWSQQRNFTTLMYSVVAFTLALYSYANARLLIPLFLLGYLISYGRELLTAKKQIIAGGFIALLLCIPLFLQMYQGDGLARYNATTILGKKVIEIFARNNKLAKEDFDNGDGWLSSKVHNFRIPIAQSVTANYLSHFNYSFLFVFADLPRHQVPGFGLLYVWQLPLILVGITFLIRNRKQLNAFLPLWLGFIAPIPAALTWQVPHSIRALLLLPVLSLVTGIGLWVVIKEIQRYDLKSYTRPPAKTGDDKFNKFLKWTWPKVSFLLIFIVMGFSVIHYLISYTILLPKEFSAYWLYRRKEAVQIIESKKENYDSITVSLSLDWSYLWFLWYGNYSPREYLSQGGTVSGGFSETQNRVGKIKFHNFDYEKQRKIPHSLMIGSPSDFPGKLIPDEKMLDLSGKPIIYIVKS